MWQVHTELLMEWLRHWAAQGEAHGFPLEAPPASPLQRSRLLTPPRPGLDRVWPSAAACPKLKNGSRTLLVTGCGRSGTHEVASQLKAAGMDVIHEQPLPRDSATALVSWPAAAALRSLAFWGLRPCYAPVLKIHRAPLAAISSLANGFAGSGSAGGCEPHSETERWDAVSWRLASRYIRMPLRNETRDFTATCGLARGERILLALHYWVGWNLLSDSVATHAVRVEYGGASPQAVRKLWCKYTPQLRRCPKNATSAAAHGRTLGSPHLLAKNNSGASSVLVHGVPLTWKDLYALDAATAKEADLLARSYGYTRESILGSSRTPQQILQR